MPALRPRNRGAGDPPPARPVRVAKPRHWVHQDDDTLVDQSNLLRSYPSEYREYRPRTPPPPSIPTRPRRAPRPLPAPAPPVVKKEEEDDYKDDIKSEDEDYEDDIKSEDGSIKDEDVKDEDIKYESDEDMEYKPQLPVSRTTRRALSTTNAEPSSSSTLAGPSNSGGQMYVDPESVPADQSSSHGGPSDQPLASSSTTAASVVLSAPGDLQRRAESMEIDIEPTPAPEFPTYPGPSIPFAPRTPTAAASSTSTSVPGHSLPQAEQMEIDTKPSIETLSATKAGPSDQRFNSVPISIPAGVSRSASNESQVQADFMEIDPKSIVSSSSPTQTGPSSELSSALPHPAPSVTAVLSAPLLPIAIFPTPGLPTIAGAVRSPTSDSLPTADELDIDGGSVPLSRSSIHAGPSNQLPTPKSSTAFMSITAEPARSVPNEPPPPEDAMDIDQDVVASAEFPSLDGPSSQIPPLASPTAAVSDPDPVSTFQPFSSVPGASSSTNRDRSESVVSDVFSSSSSSVIITSPPLIPGTRSAGSSSAVISEATHPRMISTHDLPAVPSRYYAPQKGKRTTFVGLIAHVSNDIRSTRYPSNSIWLYEELMSTGAGETVLKVLKGRFVKEQVLGSIGGKYAVIESARPVLWKTRPISLKPEYDMATRIGPPLQDIPEVFAVPYLGIGGPEDVVLEHTEEKKYPRLTISVGDLVLTNWSFMILEMHIPLRPFLRNAAITQQTFCKTFRACIKLTDKLVDLDLVNKDLKPEDYVLEGLFEESAEDQLEQGVRVGIVDLEAMRVLDVKGKRKEGGATDEFVNSRNLFRSPFTFYLGILNAIETEIDKNGLTRWTEAQLSLWTGYLLAAGASVGGGRLEAITHLALAFLYEYLSCFENLSKPFPWPITATSFKRITQSISYNITADQLTTDISASFELEYSPIFTWRSYEASLSAPHHAKVIEVFRLLLPRMQQFATGDATKALSVMMAVTAQGSSYTMTAAYAALDAAIASALVEPYVPLAKPAPKSRGHAAQPSTRAKTKRPGRSSAATVSSSNLGSSETAGPTMTINKNPTLRGIGGASVKLDSATLGSSSSRKPVAPVWFSKGVPSWAVGREDLVEYHAVGIVVIDLGDGNHVGTSELTQNVPRIVTEHWIPPPVGNSIERVVHETPGTTTHILGQINRFVCANRACTHATQTPFFRYNLSSFKAMKKHVRSCNYTLDERPTMTLSPGALGPPLSKDQFENMWWNR